MTKNGENILSKIKRDLKLQEQLKKCKTTNEVIKVLNDNNLKCTSDDFVDCASNNKVSIEELKKVSGGVACVCVAFGCGYKDPTPKHNWACACIVGGFGDGPCYCFCAIGGGGQDK